MDRGGMSCTETNGSAAKKSTLKTILGANIVKDAGRKDKAI